MYATVLNFSLLSPIFKTIQAHKQTAAAAAAAASARKNKSEPVFFSPVHPTSAAIEQHETLDRPTEML